MSTKHAADENDSDRTWYIPPNYHTPLGIDAEGKWHHKDGDAGRVYVIDPETGDLEHVQDLTAKPGLSLYEATKDWVYNYVAAKRGWADLQVTFLSASDLAGDWIDNRRGL